MKSFPALLCLYFYYPREPHFLTHHSQCFLFCSYIW